MHGTPPSHTLTLMTTPRAGRICAAAGCSRPPRQRGRYCERCHKSGWRKRNAEYAKAVEADRVFSADARLLRIARATISTAIRRGKLQAQACRDCGAKALVHHPDPSKPHDILWLCKRHRLQQRERDAEARRTASEQAEAAARKAHWTALFARFTEAWPGLLPQEQQAIWAIAQREPLIRTLHPEAPLVRQALIRAYETWCDAR